MSELPGRAAIFSGPTFWFSGGTSFLHFCRQVLNPYCSLPVSFLVFSKHNCHAQEDCWNGCSILALASVLAVEQIFQFLLQVSG